MADLQMRRSPSTEAIGSKPKRQRTEAKIAGDKSRSKTRVNIGPAFERWRKLRSSMEIKADANLAVLLLDRFSTSHQTDGSVDKAVPSKRKRSPSVHPQDEERRTSALLNDDVWVNLSCLLQLFQECGRCRGMCTVNTQEDRSHFSVVQYCKACNSWVIWNSQPLKSTSTEKGEKKEDVQVPVSLPCGDRRGRQKVTTGSEVETAAWNVEHLVEVEVNIDSDFSDELPLCRLEEEGGEEELGQQLDEMHEDDDGQLEKHSKDIKETDEFQMEEEEWSEEQQKGDSQESDPDFEISKPIERRPRVRKIFENENEGVNKVTEDQEWQREEEDEWSEEEGDSEEEEEREEGDSEEEEGDSVEEESDPDFEISAPIKRPGTRNKRLYLYPYPQRLCPNCGIMYTSQTHKCDDKRRFPCPKCGKLKVSEQNLNAHRIYCERSVFPCRFCLEPFKTKLDKVNHENGHQDTEKPYLCSKCPETFDDFCTRNRHLKAHQVLTCQTCHKQFQKLHHLQRHELSHLDDKPFKCNVCKREFAQGSQLKCHMRIHTGERPYNCQLCPMRFNHNISLKTHIRRYHQSESHLISPQSHPDSGEQPVIPRGPSSALASEPREQGESTHIPSSDNGLDPIQEPQPSRGSTEPGEVHNMTVQEKGEGEVAESVLEDQGGLTLQTKLESAEREGGGNANESRPKRKRQRNRWLNSEFEWEGKGQKDS